MESSNYVALDPKPPQMHWLVAAFLSLAFLGVGTFAIGVFSENPIAVKGLCSGGYLLFAILGTAVCWINKCRRLKQCAGPKHSTLFVYVDGVRKLAPGVVTGCVSGLFTSGGQLSLILGFYFDPSSRGIISSIVVGSALVSAIISHFVYHERISLIAYLGMVICAGGIITIALCSSADGSIVGFLFGVAALISFSLRNLASRVCERSGLDVISTGILCSTFEGLSGILFTVIYMLGWSNPYLTEDMWYWSLLGGFSIAVGAYFINQSIMTGYIGPAVTIANLMPIVQVTLDYLVEGIVPNSIKVAGCLIGILGAAVMMMGDSVIEMISRKKEKVEV